MKHLFKISGYLVIYILFVFLYILNFKGNINYTDLKLCLHYSVIPSLVGGTATNLLFK